MQLLQSTRVLAEQCVVNSLSDPLPPVRSKPYLMQTQRLRPLLLALYKFRCTTRRPRRLFQCGHDRLVRAHGGAQHIRCGRLQQSLLACSAQPLARALFCRVPAEGRRGRCCLIPECVLVDEGRGGSGARPVPGCHCAVKPSHSQHFVYC